MSDTAASHLFWAGTAVWVVLWAVFVARLVWLDARLREHLAEHHPHRWRRLSLRERLTWSYWFVFQSIEDYSDPIIGARRRMHRSIMTLQQAGLPVQEFSQTPQNLTRMGQTLLDVLRGRNLCLYPDDQLRAQALSTARSNRREAFRLAKEKASKKVDAIVALSMACVAALDEPPSTPLLTESESPWPLAPAGAHQR